MFIYFIGNSFITVIIFQQQNNKDCSFLLCSAHLLSHISISCIQNNICKRPLYIVYIQNKNLTFMNVIKKEWKVNNIVICAVYVDKYEMLSLKIYSIDQCCIDWRGCLSSYLSIIIYESFHMRKTEIEKDKSGMVAKKARKESLKTRGSVVSPIELIIYHSK